MHFAGSYFYFVKFIGVSSLIFESWNSNFLLASALLFYAISDFEFGVMKLSFCISFVRLPLGLPKFVSLSEPIFRSSMFGSSNSYLPNGLIFESVFSIVIFGFLNEFVDFESKVDDD